MSQTNRIAAKIDQHLVPEVREWWKLWSARLIALALLVDAMSLTPVLAMMPESIRTANPQIFDALQAALVAAALIARFVKQSKLEKHNGE